MNDEDDKPFAVVRQGDEMSHDGPGWYYWDAEYGEELTVS